MPISLRGVYFSRFILSFGLILLAFVWFSKEKKKRKKKSHHKHPYPSLRTPGLGHFGWLTLTVLVLLSTTFLEGSWPDPSRDPRGTKPTSALSAPLYHMHVAGMVYGQ